MHYILHTDHVLHTAYIYETKHNIYQMLSAVHVITTHITHMLPIIL